MAIYYKAKYILIIHLPYDTYHILTECHSSIFTLAKRKLKHLFPQHTHKVNVKSVPLRAS